MKRRISSKPLSWERGNHSTLCRYPHIHLCLSLGPPYFCLSQGIHSFLFEESYFSEVRSEMEPWMKELSELLDDWVLQITKSCVEIKIKEEKTRLALNEQLLMSVGEV
jgi:hypothetical protein